ncbi:Glutamyl-tRNA reductase [Clarias magur]|uniref:Glutamyl-tRNA reductase n=1 Tax=Clarias magur TaxID=1594786 RepID=A0A8J4X5R6_CLAMG|nr:Glutamyl-tRNA reductase [Clarias magur]
MTVFLSSEDYCSHSHFISSYNKAAVRHITASAFKCKILHPGHEKRAITKIYSKPSPHLPVLRLQSRTKIKNGDEIIDMPKELHAK